MEFYSKIANNDQHFSLALSRSLLEGDVEKLETVREWLAATPPEGVPRAMEISETEALGALDAWLGTPAKHRKAPALALPIVCFGEESDWLWDPAIGTKPYSLDFLDGPLGYRIARADSDSSPLRKALPKARETTNKIVWDLCGGWRVDALLMAHWGFEVESFEKSPWVHLLSSRALDRSELLVHRDELKLKTHRQDALLALESLSDAPTPSIVYIDPMYPATGSSALNQSEMRYLHALSSPDDVATALLEKSLRVATDRVVLKRPVKAPELAHSPSFHVEQGSTRYDIYLK
jgi:16S rRNA (guanine1516-N2)-methyltransferase